MIKDTNMDHYKVDGANFIEYMNDPKIGGFGNWMFANGFNSGVRASTNWISVKDRMPEEDVDVLVWNALGMEIAAYTTNPVKRWYSYNGQEVYVKYWMPLPQGAEEVNGDA